MRTSTDRLPHKNEKGKCAIKFCKNAKPERRTLCHACRKRLARIKDPKAYAFENLKRSADIRKIPFSLDRAFFYKLCEETGYDAKRGRDSDSLTIDRIDPTKGYEPENVRVIPMHENVARSNRERKVMEKFFPAYERPDSPSETPVADPFDCDGNPF